MLTDKELEAISLRYRGVEGIEWEVRLESDVDDPNYSDCGRPVYRNYLYLDGARMDRVDELSEQEIAFLHHVVTDIGVLLLEVKELRAKVDAVL